MYARTRTRAPTSMHACTHASMHAGTQSGMHAHTHTHLHTHIHTYIQTDTQTHSIISCNNVVMVIMYYYGIPAQVNDSQLHQWCHYCCRVVWCCFMSSFITCRQHTMIPDNSQQLSGQQDSQLSCHHNGGTSINQVIGLTCYYDVIDFVFVAKRRGAQNQWRHNNKSLLSRD